MGKIHLFVYNLTVQFGLTVDLIHDLLKTRPNNGTFPEIPDHYCLKSNGKRILPPYILATENRYSMQREFQVIITPFHLSPTKLRY